MTATTRPASAPSESLLDYYQQTRKRGKDWHGDKLRPLLLKVLVHNSEDIRTEVAANLLGAVRDAQAVDILIEALNSSHGRVQDSIFRALRAITYRDFAPSYGEWKNWRTDHPRGSKTNAEERGEWIVDALNAPSLEIREMVFDEIQQFDRLDLNYHPNQPKKLRARAQQELRHWLTIYPPE